MTESNWGNVAYMLVQQSKLVLSNGYCYLHQHRQYTSISVRPPCDAASQLWKQAVTTLDVMKRKGCVLVSLEVTRHNGRVAIFKHVSHSAEPE